MKPPKFHVGQAVAATISAVAEGYRGNLPMRIELVKGNIYHVTKVLRIASGWEYELREFDPLVAIHEWALVPVEEIPAEALAELLADALDPVTA